MQILVPLYQQENVRYKGQIIPLEKSVAKLQYWRVVTKTEDLLLNKKQKDDKKKNRIRKGKRYLKLERSWVLSSSGK